MKIIYTHIWSGLYHLHMVWKTYEIRPECNIHKSSTVPIIEFGVRVKSQKRPTRFAKAIPFPGIGIVYIYRRIHNLLLDQVAEKPNKEVVREHTKKTYTTCSCSQCSGAVWSGMRKSFSPSNGEALETERERVISTFVIRRDIFLSQADLTGLTNVYIYIWKRIQTYSLINKLYIIERGKHESVASFKITYTMSRATIFALYSQF